MASHLKNQKNDFWRMALILFIIASLVGAMLSVVHHFTAPLVSQSAEERLNQSLVDLMGESAQFEKVDAYSKEIILGNVNVPINGVYQVKDQADQPLGYCVNVSPMGYVDTINMMVALDTEGIVKDVELLSFSETPGIGSKVKNNKTFRTSVNGFLDSAKIVKDTPKTKDEVQVIAGATVSSAAYINGVNAAIEAVQIIRAEEVEE